MDSRPAISEMASLPVPATALPQSATPTWGKPLLKELWGTVLPALLIAVATVIFVIQPTRVRGASMEPTLHTGERVVIEKVSYRFHGPTHGDVIVLKLDGREATPLIKRVVATGGETVAIRAGQVFVSGQPAEELYPEQLTIGDLAPTVVPEGYVFVLGDNRGASHDSRHFGMVPLHSVVGRALLSYWPPTAAGPLP